MLRPLASSCSPWSAVGAARSCPYRPGPPARGSSRGTATSRYLAARVAEAQLPDSTTSATPVTSAAALSSDGPDLEAARFEQHPDAGVAGRRHGRVCRHQQRDQDGARPRRRVRGRPARRAASGGGGGGGAVSGARSAGRSIAGRRRCPGRRAVSTGAHRIGSAAGAADADSGGPGVGSRGGGGSSASVNVARSADWGAQPGTRSGREWSDAATCGHLHAERTRVYLSRATSSRTRSWIQTLPREGGDGRRSAAVHKNGILAPLPLPSAL